MATAPCTILVLEVRVEDMILPMAMVKAKSNAVNFAKDLSPMILVVKTMTMKIRKLPTIVSHKGSLMLYIHSIK